jgi:hypothetical protein
MPYIDQGKRNKICPVLEGSHKRIESEYLNCAGDLNYAFTVLAIDYIKRKGLNYQNINDILGALDGASKEFYRRMVSDYESKKAETNGDVF